MTDSYSCIEVKPILSAYFDEELSSEEKTMVENHLANCPECKKELEHIGKISASVKKYFQCSMEELEIKEKKIKENALNKLILFQRRKKFVYSFSIVALIAIITYFSLSIIALNATKSGNSSKIKYNQTYVEGKSQLIPFFKKKNIH